VIKLPVAGKLSIYFVCINHQTLKQMRGNLRLSASRLTINFYFLPKMWVFPLLNYFIMEYPLGTFLKVSLQKSLAKSSKHSEL
jgi:hypothetical protein